MGRKWYYAENGERAGPATSEEIVNLIGRDDGEPTLVWSEGLSLSAPLTAEDAKKSAELKRMSLAGRARNELIEYLAIASYLAVWFGALLFYKATILESAGVDTTRLSIAIVKALILGKFVLILEHLKIGRGNKAAHVLVFHVLKQALLFTLLLFVLTAIEEVVVGFIHGEIARDALKGFAGGTRPEAIATMVLMFMVLIPYFAYRDIAAKLGEEALLKFLFTRQPMKNHAPASPLDEGAAPLKDAASGER